MSKKFLATLVAFISAFVFAFPVSAQTAERPALKVGDSCSYQRLDGFNGSVKGKYDVTVAAVSPEGYEMVERSQSTGKTYAFRETHDLNLTAYVAIRYSPDSGTYDFPLSVGKEWKKVFSITFGNGTRVRHELVATVVGEERVSVPGGEFLAFKIESKDFLNIEIGEAGSGSMQRTVWYAPSIGCLVKEVFVNRGAKGEILSTYTTEITAFKKAD